MKKVLVLVAVLIIPFVAGCNSQGIHAVLYGTPTATATSTATATATATMTSTATIVPTATPEPWTPATEGWHRTPQWDGDASQAWADQTMQLWTSQGRIDIRFLFDLRWGYPFDYDEQRLADTLMALGMTPADVGEVLTSVHAAEEAAIVLPSGWTYSLAREPDNRDTWYLVLFSPSVSSSQG